MTNLDGKIAALLILLIAMFQGASMKKAKKEAYATILSSDSFLLAVRVLALALNETNSSRPYLVMVTEHVSEQSIQVLKREGVTVRKTEEIETPYIETHLAKKFKYTKVHLWAQSDFETFVHFDADVLPLTNVDELFRCGGFCASMRHSDMFNSGVFVMHTSEEVYNDMISKVDELESYDGGDQGFLNSYFDKVKSATMFDPNSKAKQKPSQQQRLSGFYNFDIGMYYVNARSLAQPKIIHFTLGPMKPWFWWSYPLFDLNWKWLTVRDHLENRYPNDRKLSQWGHPVFCMLTLAIAYWLCLKLLQTSKLFLRFLPNSDTLAGQFFAFVSVLLSNYVAYKCVPSQIHPLTAWPLFSTFKISVLLAIFSIYSRKNIHCKMVLPENADTKFTATSSCRSGFSCKQCLAFNAAYLCLLVAAFKLAANIEYFYGRVWFLSFAVLISEMSLYLICRRFQNYSQIRL